MATYESQFRDWSSPNKELNGPRNIVCDTSNPYHHASTLKKAATMETAKELRKKLKAAEKRERLNRKAEKRVKAANKVVARRRKIALDALERVAQGGGINAVSAARSLLELG